MKKKGKAIIAVLPFVGIKNPHVEHILTKEKENGGDESLKT